MPRAGTGSMDDVFNAPDAELVLRSSEGVEFSVHKIMLQLASPMFSTMLELPQPISSEPSSSRPIIEMSEDTETLRLLLRLCYPRSVCAPPKLSQIKDIERAAHIARKFDIGFIREAAEHAILLAANDNAKSAYGVAYQYEYPEALLRQVARRSLGPISFVPQAPRYANRNDWLDGLLESILGGRTKASNQSLDKYKSAAVNALGDILRLGADREHPIRFLVYHDVIEYTGSSPCTCDKIDLWIESFSTGESYPEGRPTIFKPIRRWWWSFVQDVIVDLQSAQKLSISAACDQAAPAAIECSKSCDRCKKQEEAVTRLLKDKTRYALEDEIEKRLEQVPIDAPFLPSNSL
ncbi:hypothetical protein PENSPDRAFT_657446 [Peniophora sp. CONT]|nr:hypothetical protein PENSPDRAFT_657446 [Peniophora sp. CONT]